MLTEDADLPSGTIPAGAPQASAPQAGTPTASAVRLVLIGLVSAAFFSSTFILNYSMSLEGGPWVWSAALRYLFTILLLLLWIGLRYGPTGLTEVFAVFRERLWFWLISGTIGCGLFYAGICFAADHARGWVIAATFQTTIIASPLVLLLFGFRFPKRGLLFSALILAGVVLINVRGLRSGVGREEILLGVLPLLLSAVAFPLGNQMLNAAKNGMRWVLAPIDRQVLGRPSACVLLMSLGSVPFWLLLCVVVQPPVPAGGQVFSTFLVALFSGVIATTIFFFARNATNDPFRIAAVDATQSGEVAFALLGELLLLGAGLPDLYSQVGLALLVAGLIGYSFRTAPQGA